MDTIEEMFTGFMEGMYEVEEIPKEIYDELRKVFYSGFARGCMVYEEDLDGLSKTQALHEKRLLKLEFETYLESIGMLDE